MPLQLGRTETLKSRVVSVLDLDRAELHAWDELCRSCPQFSSPFLSPEYARSVASSRPNVYACVILAGGQPVGFLPFQFRDAFHKLLRAAERVGEEMTDRFGMIARPGLRTDPATLLRLAGLKYFYFTHLEEEQFAYGLYGGQPERGVNIRLDGACSYWEDLRRRDKKLACDTERRRRQMEQAHGLLRFCFAEADVHRGLELLIERKREQYRRTGRPDALAAPWKRSLLRALAACRSENCSGILSTLYAGDTWVASHFGIRSRTVLQYWFPVYNPALSRFAPGRLLLMCVIHAAAGAGIQIIDRGAGDTPAKREMGNAPRLYYRGEWLLASPESLACRIAHSLRWRLAGFNRHVRSALEVN
jgi:CelD/BcsL family acetyltransferase involved in cellulose biosynthesis